MTMPHLMNCSHLLDGWCLTCVGKLNARLDATLDALLDVEQAGHNPADLCPDLIGKPDRYETLVLRLAGAANNALVRDRKARQ